MENRKLNSLVVSYQSTRNETTFHDIFEEVNDRWKSTKTLEYLAKKHNLSLKEAEIIAHEKMFETSLRYDESKADFIELLFVAINLGCIDSYRKEKKHKNNVSLDFESENEEDCAFVEYLVCANAEDEAIELIQKKYDQRQLIASLTQKVPDKYRQALETFASCDFSYSDAAKRLNISYPAVKRRVEKIALYFSEEEHGYLHDYLTA